MKKLLSGLFDYENKYWSRSQKKWVTPFKGKYFKWLNAFLPHKSFFPVSYPVVYTPKELVAEYPNKWNIPVSPEIKVLHEGKLIGFSDFKQFYK